jgi:prepilin-type N-terminal cleavage/methylation domain-containing protein
MEPAMMKMKMKMKKKIAAKEKSKKQTGFSLVEVMISTMILTVGSLGLLGLFGVAMAANQTSQQDTIARQLASEAMESIYTARNTSQLGFTQINNISNGGIFTDGAVAVKCAGPDGILGTADDSSCLTAAGVTCPNGGVECLTEPGVDGIVGTADDVTLSLSNYSRQIQISSLLDTSGNVIPTLVSVTITIRYTVSNVAVQKSYVLNEYVSSYD